MKKKNIKPEEVEVVIPKEVEAINICGDIDSFIKHIIYVSLDKVSSDRAFVNNDILYMVTYASIKGKNIPVGVLAKQKEAKSEDIAMPFEDIGRDVNVVYPIEIGKMFKGFYILSNGSVAIDYELTDNGGFDDDDSIGKIDMNLNWCRHGIIYSSRSGKRWSYSLHRSRQQTNIENLNSKNSKFRTGRLD